MIDLTLEISSKLLDHPDSPEHQFIQWQNLHTDGYNLELMFLSTHTGTHMDAPFHFYDKGIKIHQIKLNRLVQDAILIKIKKSNKIITLYDIKKFEKNHSIPEHSTVIFATFWSTKQTKFYFTKCPGLSLSAAKYLVSKKINMVGIDSPSIDQGSSTTYAAHKILAQNNILIVENLINLNQIKKNPFKLIVLPLKLHNASGSPVRAIAI